MNGIHDMGGMDGFGAVVREANEPVFHAPWERRTFAIAIGLLGRRGFNVDEYRRAIERMPPADYLRASYYEKWLFACESLLIEKGIVTRGELNAAYGAAGGVDGAAPPVSVSESSQSPAAPVMDVNTAPGKKARTRARFRIGDTVVARNLNPLGHTRLPRYARGHRGVVRYDRGVFVFPDTHAHSRGANPQRCYTVEFDGRELWGKDHPVRERVLIDLWEDYLEAASSAPGSTATRPTRAIAHSRVKAPTKPSIQARTIAKDKARTPMRKK